VSDLPVRRALERSRAGPPGLIRIGQTWVAQGFAEEWLDWRCTGDRLPRPCMRQIQVDGGPDHCSGGDEHSKHR
jgi:hypothetical protein